MSNEVRRLNEAEARAAAVMFHKATMYARMTATAWYVQKGGPTKDDLIDLANNLKAAEDDMAHLIAGRESDGHALDNSIAFFHDQITELDAAAPGPDS
jgi:hypothetical protein